MANDEIKLPSDNFQPAEVKPVSMDHVSEGEATLAAQKIDDARKSATSAKEFLGLAFGILKSIAK